MTISARQSVETILSRKISALVVYPLGYTFAGQCVDMLWSTRPENKGHDPG
jgi:hypothetical protein